MDKVLRVYAYIDDMLVASKDKESHMQHLKEVFRQLSYYWLHLNLDKCVFEAPSIEFLAHCTNVDGITPLQTKINSIQDFPMPTSIKQLRHGLSHLSKRATVKLIPERFIWPNMNVDIQEWVSTCLKCQQCKVHWHTKSPISTFNNPGAWFSHIHIDLVGPMPMCQDYQYLLTVVDHFSQWPTAVPIKDISTNTIAKTILKEWMSTYGTLSHHDG